MFLAGEAGIGKTTLVEHFIGRLPRLSADALSRAASVSSNTARARPTSRGSTCSTICRAIYGPATWQRCCDDVRRCGSRSCRG